MANNWREDELLFLIVKAGLATHNSNHGPQERAGTDVGYLHVNVATSSGRRNTGGPGVLSYFFIAPTELIFAEKMTLFHFVLPLFFARLTIYAV